MQSGLKKFVEPLFCLYLGYMVKQLWGVGVPPFTHEPIYVSKRAHLDGPITPVVMDSSPELGSFLMMTSDWGLSQSSVIFFIAVAGYVLYWIKSIPNPSELSDQFFWIRRQEMFWIKWSIQSKDDKKEGYKDECSYDIWICVCMS